VTTLTRSLVSAAVVLLAVGCSSAPPPAPAAAVTTVNSRPGCIPAPAEPELLITPTLIGDAKKIREIYMIEENNRRYIGANIYDGAGKELSTGDVWILEGTKVYALSSGARSNSSGADARELPDKPSSGTGNSRFVAECARPA
jgi:hypothetical protein